ncbi:MAG: HNH endonuclease, partial [Acidimicrobiia bacterium]|nr:HNH endonuclease [Acidimicrobiia bacterium]
LEIDHIKPFAEGGATSLENLVRLCKRHHLQKTHDGYRLIKIAANKGEIGVEKEARWDWRAPPDLRNTG